MTLDVLLLDKFLMSDVLSTNLMLTGLFCFSHLLSFQDENKLDSWFLSSFHQFLTQINVWLLSFQTKEALFALLRLTFHVNYKRLLHLMAIFRPVSDSTRVIALC